MNINLFEQARNLAESLLNTPEGKKYQEAKYIFEGDDIAMNKLQEYTKMRENLKMQTRRNENKEELDALKQELNTMLADIKSDEVITNLFNSEEQFNKIVTSVMDIFNATLTGNSDEDAGGGCCGSGGCGGCSGCH